MQAMLHSPMRQPPVHSFGHESPAGFGSGGHVPPVVVSGLSVVVPVLVEVPPVVVLVVEVAPVVVLVVLVLVEVAPAVLAVAAVVDVGSAIVGMLLDGEPVPSEDSVVPALVLTAPVPSPLVSLGTRPSLQPRRVAAASTSAWGTCVDRFMCQWSRPRRWCRCRSSLQAPGRTRRADRAPRATGDRSVATGRASASRQRRTSDLEPTRLHHPVGREAAPIPRRFVVSRPPAALSLARMAGCSSTETPVPSTLPTCAKITPVAAKSPRAASAASAAPCPA